MKAKIRLLIRKVDPPAAPKQKTQDKCKKTTASRSTSMRSKLQNIPSENTNIYSTPDTSLILPLMDYNIIDDMKKT